MAKTKYLKVGRQRYILRGSITETKYLILKDHPQANTFYFKHGKTLINWYVKTASVGSASTTQKVQIALQKSSYKEYLSKNKF